MATVKHLQQRFWRDPQFPYFELRTTYTCEAAFKLHSHPQLSLGAIIEGETQSTIRGETLSCKAGDLVLLPANITHSCDPIEGRARSYHMLYVEERWCLHKLSQLHGGNVVGFAVTQYLIQQPELFHRFLDLVKCIDRADPKGINQYFNELLTEILLYYCSTSLQAGCENTLGDAVKSLLVQQLHRPPNLEELAQQFGYRKETIIRAFNKSFGVSPKVFLNSVRIEKAKSLLKRGGTISDVALSLGFSDQAQFHKTFVKYTAATPKQYQIGTAC